MDVTDQILHNVKIYGSSDDTNPAFTAGTIKLNYANGASIQDPQVAKLSAIPYTFKFNDTVGLFGSENYFIRVDLNIGGVALTCLEEPGWRCATITLDEKVDAADPYTYPNEGDTPGAAYLNNPADEGDEPDYQAAGLLRDEIPEIRRPMVRIDLTNLKTGNHYLDSWLDVRLYTEDKVEHPYDRMYCQRRDSFYIGFHARNTKRLPYNVECKIGEEWVTEDLIDSAFMMHKLIN